MKDNFPRREFTSRAALRRWLAENHTDATTFWLVTCKKHTGDRYLAYGEIVEELLSFGWVDARTNRLDDDRSMLLVAPRKPGSTWSASNKKRVAKLVRDGLMTEAGQAKIDAAKRDGSWTFLDDIDRLVVPDDLAAALAKNPAAKDNYSRFADSAKRVILYWIKCAKRETTRAERIAETVRLAAKNLKAAHPEARGQ